MASLPDPKITSRQDHFLIVLEGANGAGKTTQKLLLHEMINKILPCLYFHDSNYAFIDACDDVITQVFAYNTARSRRCHSVYPYIAPSRVLLLDRFWPSTLVYHGEWYINESIHAMNKLASGDYYEADAWVFLEHCRADHDRALRYRFLYEQFVDKYRRPAWFFDTSTARPEETAEAIMAVLTPLLVQFKARQEERRCAREQA